MSEVLDRYVNLADQFQARVDAAPDDAWGNASPCEGWSARDVVKHVVEGQRRVVAGIEDREPEPVADDADPRQLWQESYAAFKQALADDSVLQKQVPGPMGPMPVEFVVGRFMATDVLVHTWDLAKAVGGDTTLDADAVSQAYKGLQPMDAMIRGNGVFGPKVEAPEGADEQTQFLCFVGRQP
ncbi:MAG TPA: TIGR03086 family metal-binding protein [Acidimicrobiales bacterium]|nr:TIGR03086 family metal-binding protein [Acidimicrobiales bacterium]